MSTLDQAMNYLADRADVGTYLHYTGSKAVSASTQTTVLSVTVQPGIWLAISNMDLSVSYNSTYNHYLDGMVVRSHALNGGGSTNCKVIKTSSTYTLTAQVYIGTACTARERLWLIKLGPYV